MSVIKTTVTQFCVRSNLMIKGGRLKGSGISLFEELSQQSSGWNEEHQ
jgi:hypothetical protein